MANSIGDGWFDPSVVSNTWFDIQIVEEGWWAEDYVTTSVQTEPPATRRRIMIIT